MLHWKFYLNYSSGNIRSKIKEYFNGIDYIYEMNEGQKRFTIKKIEIYYLIILIKHLNILLSL